MGRLGVPLGLDTGHRPRPKGILPGVRRRCIKEREFENWSMGFEEVEQTAWMAWAPGGELGGACAVVSWAELGRSAPCAPVPKKRVLLAAI